jgi:hypothetical protein
LNLGSAQSVAMVLRKHVLFELEGIDRMYLNVFVPVLQAGRSPEVHPHPPWASGGIDGHGGTYYAPVRRFHRRLCPGP